MRRAANPLRAAGYGGASRNPSRGPLDLEPQLEGS
jgi:hypothetical protein